MAENLTFQRTFTPRRTLAELAQDILSGKFINKMMEEDIGLGPQELAPVVGMIPTAENLAKFDELVSAGIKAIAKDPNNPTKAERALGWFRVRHPKLNDLINSTIEKTERKIKGEYRWPDPKGTAVVFEKERSIPQYIETIGHEFGHGIRDIRNPESMVDLEQFIKETRSSISDAVIKHPEEQIARRYGARAAGEAAQYEGLKNSRPGLENFARYIRDIGGYQSPENLEILNDSIMDMIRRLR